MCEWRPATCWAAPRTQTKLTNNVQCLGPPAWVCNLCFLPPAASLL